MNEKGSDRGPKPVTVSVHRLAHGEGLPLPGYQTAASSGADIRAAVDGDVVIRPGERVLIPTGFRVAIPQGFEIQVRPRSGLALKHGVTILNAPGTIDADYRGELGILLVNLGQNPYTVRRGERIAQLVLAGVAGAAFREVPELPGSGRGEGGFGHTGEN
jgi:dUTP pyrophosphatase